MLPVIGWPTGIAAAVAASAARWFAPTPIVNATSALTATPTITTRSRPDRIVDLPRQLSGGYGPVRSTVQRNPPGEEPLDVLRSVRPARHRVAGDAGRRHRVVVAAGVQPVADEQHVRRYQAERVHQLAHRVRLVHPLAGDVDRRRPAAADLEVGQARGRVRPQPFALGAGRVPAALRLDRRGLSERGERDLAAAVLHDLAPGVRLPQSEVPRALREDVDHPALHLVGQVLGVLQPPPAVHEPVVAGAVGGHQMQPGQRAGVGGQVRQYLRAELLEAAPGHDAHLDHSEQAGEQARHPRVDRRLGRCGRVVEVEGHHPDIGHPVEATGGGWPRWYGREDGARPGRRAPAAQTRRRAMVSRLNPYLTFDGNARQAMEFYADVFGGRLALTTFAEFGAADTPDADRIMHAMLETDEGYNLMASDVTSDMKHEPMAGMSISLSGDDADALRGY